MLHAGQLGGKSKMSTRMWLVVGLGFGGFDYWSLYTLVTGLPTGYDDGYYVFLESTLFVVLLAVALCSFMRLY